MVRYTPTFEGCLQYSPDHNEIFGRGWEHTVYTKAMLLHFEKGLRKLWRQAGGQGNGNLGYKRRIERPANGKFEVFFRKHFKEITGFDVTRAQEFKAEVKKNNGYLQPRDRKGPEPEKLEEEYPDLKAWVDLKIEQASRGSYLTIKRLMDKFKKDFILCKELFKKIDSVKSYFFFAFSQYFFNVSGETPKTFLTSSKNLS